MLPDHGAVDAVLLSLVPERSIQDVLALLGVHSVIMLKAHEETQLVEKLGVLLDRLQVSRADKQIIVARILGVHRMVTAPWFATHGRLLQAGSDRHPLPRGIVQLPERPPQSLLEVHLASLPQRAAAVASVRPSAQPVTLLKNIERARREKALDELDTIVRMSPQATTNLELSLTRLRPDQRDQWMKDIWSPWATGTLNNHSGRLRSYIAWKASGLCSEDTKREPLLPFSVPALVEYLQYLKDTGAGRTTPANVLYTCLLYTSPSPRD